MSTSNKQTTQHGNQMHKWFIALLVFPSLALAAEPDWSEWDQLLAAHVRAGAAEGIQANLVDYPGIAQDPAFAAVVEQVRSFDVARLEGRAETLAFYINAYNILTIQLIIDNWPLESIRDIGSFFSGPWDIVMLENADGELTLDDIEHEIIRSYGEPRIHFAVNCASLSCPDLRREAYVAKRLDAQLEDQTQRFFRQPNKGAELRGDTLHVTRLLRWYKKDFRAGGGTLAFVRRYRGDLEFKSIDADLDYNWSLNRQ